MLSKFTSELKALEEQALYRFPPDYTPLTATKVKAGNQEYLMMASNNYLGLTHHPAVQSAARHAVSMYGTGSGGSRLTSGSHCLFARLEKHISEFEGTERAIVFNTGYTTNLGVISTLMGKGDFIFSDELNHASIIDGCRLSKATTMVYPHKDTQALESLLKHNRGTGVNLIATDGVFSMDGDIAPLDELYALAKKYNALLLVDDAHATGVIGNGHGSAAAYNLQGKIDLQIGTLSKALASEGGFVATNSILAEYLINKARSYIFSTALTPADIAAADRALELIEDDSFLVKRLYENIEYMKSCLTAEGIVVATETAIFPIVVHDNMRSLAIARELATKGIILSAIRPPTVAPDSSRLRLTVTAAHSHEELAYVAKMLGKAILAD